jgi:hypothetical protein
MDRAIGDDIEKWPGMFECLRRSAVQNGVARLERRVGSPCGRRVEKQTAAHRQLGR